MEECPRLTSVCSRISPSMINGNWSEASISAAAKRCGMTPFVRQWRRRQLLPDERNRTLFHLRQSDSLFGSFLSLFLSLEPTEQNSPSHTLSLGFTLEGEERNARTGDLDLHARIVAITTDKKKRNVHIDKCINRSRGSPQCGPSRCCTCRSNASPRINS